MGSSRPVHVFNPERICMQRAVFLIESMQRAVDLLKRCLLIYQKEEMLIRMAISMRDGHTKMNK